MLSARAALLFLLVLPGTLSAQRAPESLSPWTLRLRGAISGSSDDSQPEGYQIYSGIALEAAVERRMGTTTAVELSVRTESREVLGPGNAAGDNRLGSLEMLPVTLLVRWLPRAGHESAFQPYVGAGGNVTVTWEKTGALDSSDVPAGLHPAVGLGTDYVLSERLVLNLDVKWHPMKARITNFRSPDPTVKLDPMTFGLGLGVRF